MSKVEDYEKILIEVAKKKRICYSANGDCYLDMTELLDIAVTADEVLKKHGVYIDDSNS